MPESAVITGGGRGVGRAIGEKLLARDIRVVVIDIEAPDWAHPHLTVVEGDAADPETVARAADAAEALAPLMGWVNNAAVFRDAWIHEDPAGALEVIAENLVPAVVGTAEAVRRFLAAKSSGSIVNVSSHQAQRPVAGALPYATAKAALEGLTRATAVDYGRFRIRANAVALGSIVTERFEGDVRVQGAHHALGRMGTTNEVADVVAWLLSNESSFVSGSVIPVDGARAAWGRDPEERWPTGL
jgi:NAD(P)-dependent dehydrogenase (short-subunit alcohol dehydrogenase family)